MKTHTITSSDDVYFVNGSITIPCGLEQGLGVCAFCDLIMEAGKMMKEPYNNTVYMPSSVEHSRTRCTQTPCPEHTVCPQYR